MKRTLTLTLAGLALTFVSGESRAADYTLKIAHAGPATMENDDYVGSTSLKQYIEKKSGGKIAVEIYPGNQLGNYQEVIEQVNAGALESAHTSIGGITPFLPEMAVVDLQYLLPGDDVAYTFMDGSFTQKMADAVKAKLSNVKLVAVSDGGRWRSFYTTKTEIQDADDLKGLKIRTINSPLQQEFVRSLGAAATPVSWGELYTALATGQVEGTKNATPDIINYGILDRHTSLFGYYFLSESWLKNLPADLQSVVLNGYAYAAQKQTVFNKNVEDSANKRFVDGGGKLYEPTEKDRATFMGARDSMKNWYVEKYGDKWLKIMMSAIEEAKARAGYEN